MTDYDLFPYIFYAGGYHQITADRVAAAGVSYSRGVTDELDLQKGNLSFRLLDDDDQYRPSNAASPLYGIVGPYLPMAYLLGGSPRFAGELDELAPGQTDDHKTTAGLTTRGVRWVDIKATGPLGAVGRLRDQIASPLALQIRSLPTLRGYWPGEDGSDATVMSSSYPGVEAAYTTGVSFAAADGPFGSNKLLTIGTGGLVQGSFPTNVSTTSWQISWVTNLAGADGTERQAFAWRTSNGYWWVWSAALTTYRITVVDPTGTIIHSANVTNGGVAPGMDIVFRMKCTLSGGTWTVDQGWYQQNSPNLAGITTTFAGTAGRPTMWKSGANTIMVGGYLGHVFSTTGTSDNLQSYAMLSALNGYPGETTADRFSRICGLRRLPFTVLGNTALATRQGPQRPGTVKAQLQEIQQTEQGLIFESASGRGIKLALRNYLYGQCNAPVLDLTYPTHIGPGFSELATTLELYNTVIAQDRSGVSATAVQAAGRYGTADPPDGAGVVDKTLNVNMANPGDVVHLAGSALTYFQQVGRFAEITVDLDQNPGLRTAAEAVDIGMCIRLIGRTPDPVLLLVVRISGRDQRKRHTITFEVVPADVFSTGQWDGTGVAARRWDLSTCTLSGAHTSTATTLNLAMTDDESWSTLAEPYDLMIAGERVTVTNMNARTGTGPYAQTATVTRSVNGVVKAQAAGAEVHVAARFIWGW